MVKIRIDKLLCDKGLAPSREKAQALIMAGCVLVSEKPVTKPGQLVDPNAKIRITGQDHPYVGRGGVKLAHALQEFGINVKGKVCVDVGASTGGFTDCLLQNGAALVYAIDVGYGQLDWKLRNDKRVVVMERVNIRQIACHPRESGDLGIAWDSRFHGNDIYLKQHVQIAVIDVSFISLEKVFPHVDKLVSEGGTIIALIKPQFEAGKDKVGKGGIVRDEKVREECVENACKSAEALGWIKRGVAISPITGADGNIEFLAWFAK
ncbi:MAG: TlyA family RNA methyltransferase [Deltaproteobacteria bacterium]|nr:TlyA family RNA methyltransferase [Deltaproteobacteria bacterium]